MKKILIAAALLLVAYSGEPTTVSDRCCECDCEYNPMEDAKWFDEPLTVRFRYFGGAPHVCLGNHCRDEKGIDISKKHEPHICRGVWCDKRCCIPIEEFAGLQEEYERRIRGNIIRYPVIPGPGPVTRDN